MIYTIDDIKKDLFEMNIKQFYMKYIVKSDNWYFRSILDIPENKIIDIVDEFKNIVSSSIGVSFNSVMMVGSGKVGYSLSPKKHFKKFEVSNDSKNKSDIDIAIISYDLFERLWKYYRAAYSIKYSYLYKYISREIYRGYINEKNIHEIEDCRKVWNELSNKANKKLRNDLYLRHDITYRIYRTWEDFEEYNLDSIDKLKTEVSKNAI